MSCETIADFERFNLRHTCSRTYYKTRHRHHHYYYRLTTRLNVIIQFSNGRPALTGIYALDRISADVWTHWWVGYSVTAASAKFFSVAYTTRAYTATFQTPTPPPATMASADSDATREAYTVCFRGVTTSVKSQAISSKWFTGLNDSHTHTHAHTLSLSLSLSLSIG